jgi:hypothetical protein
MVRLKLEDGTEVEASREVAELIQSIRIRKSVCEFVAPLSRDGIDSIAFVAAETITEVKLGDRDAPAFQVPETEPRMLADQTVELVVAIVAPALSGGYKWRFAEDNQTTWHATMADEAFLDRMGRRVELFGVGDLLRCRVRIVQRRGAMGLQTDREIIKVIEHIPAEIQLELEDEDAAEPAAQ